MGNVLECSADPLSDLEDDGDESSPSSRIRTLQEATRLSTSMLFNLNRDCYADIGPKAYVDGIVPHYVSSSSFVAKAYATVVLEFMHDWFREDNPHANPSEPLYIVEVGAGLGKLGYLVVRELLAAREFYPEMCGGEAPFRYILTDCVPQNLKYWDQHDQLKPLFELGVLDSALLDASVPGLGGEIRLTHSGETISPGHPVYNPIVCICNYVMNALPHDAFQIRQDGKVYLASCTTRTRAAAPLAEEDDESDDGSENARNHDSVLKPHEIIQGLDCEWSYSPVRSDDFEPLFGNSTVLNSIPEAYRQLIRHRKREDLATSNVDAKQKAATSRSTVEDKKYTASFSVPLAGITMLQSLARMSSGRRLLVLLGDKGYTRFSEMFGVLRNPHLARHGSFSTMVNFHALQMFVDQIRSNESSLESRGSADSKMEDGGNGRGSAFMRISPFSEGFKTALISLGMGSSELPQSVWAFEDWAYSRGPDQLSSLQRHEGQQCPNATIEHALGLLRLCDYDPEVFLKFKKQFIVAVGDPKTPRQMRKDIGMLTGHVMARHFTISNNKDIWFELARIHMGLGEYRKAGILFDASNRKCGEHHVTHHNKGICLFYIGKLTEAKEAFGASLTMCPGYAEAVKWKDKVEEAIGAEGTDGPTEAAKPQIV